MSPRQNINVCHARCGTLACLVVPNDHRLSEICVIFNDTDLLNLVPSQLGFHDSGHRVVVGSITSGRWGVAGGLTTRSSRDVGCGSRPPNRLRSTSSSTRSLTQPGISVDYAARLFFPTLFMTAPSAAPTVRDARVIRPD